MPKRNVVWIKRIFCMEATGWRCSWLTNWCCHGRSGLWLFAIGCCLLLPHQVSAQFAADRVPSHEVYTAQQYLQTVSCNSVDLVEGDEIWWITSRNVSGQLDSLDELVAVRLTHQGWTLEDAATFCAAHNYATDSPLDPLSLIYVHGNRTNPKWSIKRGLQVYEQVFGSRGDRRPVRFVIWHWPADQVILPVQEFEDNAKRAIVHGRHFARFLQYLDPRKPVRLMGYSLGSQFLLSACEQLAKFAESNCGNADLWQHSNLLVVVIASVTSCQWPKDTRQIQRAASLVDSALVFENKDDKALKYFKIKCNLDTANCFCGPNAFRALANFGTSAEHLEIGKAVGSDHSVAKYVAPDFIQNMILGHLGF